MKIWSISDIQDTESYRLLLCQNPSGRRYFKIDPVYGKNKQPHEDEVLSTQTISNEILKRGDIFDIANTTPLSCGEKFFIDSHGIWLTKTEVEQMDKGISYDRINWVTTTPPFFPDR
ncbi:hypothetical protein [Metapseudomonas otitidis]|uniref:hypothetical protein n=1 Tax=Metapseudomonas otitidis TaxID=319939 RepID=UPI0013F5AE11|nr:hypothetical protein [Pseudomonas otitidis]